MSPADLIFLIERFMSPLERKMVDSLNENRGDKFSRDAYADWLQEQGFEWGSRLVREGYTPPNQMSPKAQGREILSGYHNPYWGLTSG